MTMTMTFLYEFEDYISVLLIELHLSYRHEDMKSLGDPHT